VNKNAQPKEVPSTDTSCEALALLRAHRQQSGYAPWPQADNEQLREADRQRQRRTQEDRAFADGLAVYRKLTTPDSRLARLADHIPQVEPPAKGEDDTLTPATTGLTVRVDPELARLAVALNKAGEFRVWLIARHFFGQPGWVEKERLREVLATEQIASRRQVDRVLKQGDRLFWGRSPSGRIFLRAYVRVAERLTRLARETQPQLVATNVPGARDVYLRVGGTLGAFKAQVYAGWLTHREAPKISRQVLAALFGCSQETLRNWERELGSSLAVVPNYAQCAVDPRLDDWVASHIPEHSYSYVTSRGQMRIRWRQPNSYNPQRIRQHPHKGQSRKARTKAISAAWYQPVELCAHGLATLAFDRSHRVPRRYFATAKALRAFLERLKRRKRGQPLIARYVSRGEDRNRHGIWELSPDGEVQTSANERMQLKREYGWWAGWRANCQMKRAG
jgi:hypothetical protein